ncbi:MAG: MotA/TolQ/ExbB proton channel family protein, partial [Planctomycetaceae bacterium]|nr:MotA/TolQ/ExbB proton channel family protein [Planctomycetaceae bacterium]
MARSGTDSPRLGYLAALTMLVFAFLFPIGLMVFNPTLMFERGWEQYVGTAIYLWAVITLGRELWWLWRNEKAFEDAPRLLQYIGSALRREILGPNAGQGPDNGSEALVAAVTGDGRILQVRVRQLLCNMRETHAPTAAQLMEINREASGLDQEHMAGRFTLTRYILYLLPVIGFIGTVEGISKALMNISKVLPMVKDLDAFLNNLTGVTSALQIAFDITLLALFLSAALMLVQTLVFRKSEALLARVDGWVVESVLPGVGSRDPSADRLDELIGPHLDRLRRE